ncbi:ABC transporter substrate-binding protein [Pelagibius litoralis]|uniref:ABC transporter substrate-binding protein n=1 Tax=Pelagibius litoralis TaxID=374515 RepID=A0A967EXP6_9PROT|nr:putative urea ABC transporter substrate-binding protein [Pelagibius litoralis]NIA69332.1 ABC transporter substrate-binding protein [Pelagibius litoralis]
MLRILSRKLLSSRLLLGLFLLALAATLQPAQAAKKESFRIAWSIYVGWMPWAYADEMGIVKKWADKYGIEIEVVQINDYIESINQFTAGAFDGTVMTNMDALSIPAGGGLDSTALIIGDFSNGNDGLVVKGEGDIAALKGKNVNLVELSVSHYLLARALDSAKLTERELTVVNTSDADMVAAYKTADVEAVVTWNPLLSEIAAEPGAKLLYTSADIPGEIIDMMVVNTEVLNDNPDFGKALVGAWYETMAVMSADDEAGKAARTFMGEKSGTDLAGYEAQLATTRMFYEPAEAIAFAKSEDLMKTMDVVRRFLFDHGILGEGAPSPDYVGMTFPSGATLGDQANTKLRFDADFMGMAAEGAL